MRGLSACIAVLLLLTLVGGAAHTASRERAADPDLARLAARYALLIRWINGALTPHDAYAVAWWTLYYSRAFGLDPRLVVAVIWTESRFRHTAVSSRGAIGFGQIMPATGRGLGINPADPLHNLWATSRLLWGHYMQFRDWRLALAAYNAGSGTVRRYGGVPPYEETRWFVATVLVRYSSMVRAGW